MPSRMREAHERLRWARVQAGFHSATAFAESIDVEAGTYRHHENGKRNMRPSVAANYARKLGVDPQWLLFGLGQPKPGIELSPNLMPVSWAPVLTWVQAGMFSEAPVVLDEITEKVPVVYNRSTIFALEVRGDSMDREAAEGDLIIVDYEDRTPKDRLLYVIREGGDATFKRYRDTGGPVRLEPDSSNKAHETIYPTNHLEVVGRVVFILKKR